MIPFVCEDCVGQAAQFTTAYVAMAFSICVALAIFAVVGRPKKAFMTWVAFGIFITLGRCKKLPEPLIRFRHLRLDVSFGSQLVLLFVGHRIRQHDLRFSIAAQIRARSELR